MQRLAQWVEFDRGKPGGWRENLLVETAKAVERRREERECFMLSRWTAAGH